MARDFIVLHSNPGESPIIIFIDSITSIKDYGDGTCCVFIRGDNFYNVTESLSSIMRKLNSRASRIVNN